jgi:uncharacterized protein YbjT (DUF2867 family)
MNLVTGATGNVGSSLIKALISKREKVTVITRDRSKAEKMFGNPVEIVQADIMDTESLHQIFTRGSAIFVLNPSADPSGNTDIEERKTAKSLVAALQQLDMKRLVVESTMGNQPGDHKGDLGVLYELEQDIKELPYDYRIIRPTYYMSNWKNSISEVKETGELSSFYPADFKFPMVAPDDIGALASELMTTEKAARINPILGPEEYSANDVAAALGETLSRNVKVKVIPRKEWENFYQSIGFSAEAAESYANMTEISFNEGFERPKNAVIGKTTLTQYFRSITAKTI